MQSLENVNHIRMCKEVKKSSPEKGDRRDSLGAKHVTGEHNTNSDFQLHLREDRWDCIDNSRLRNHKPTDQTSPLTLAIGKL